MDMKTIIQPSFQTHSDASKFFIDIVSDEGEDGKMMVNLRKATVVVTTTYGDKVAFYKTNRGQNYRDSRGRKVSRKNEWGDVETFTRPLMIGPDEVMSELTRLLDSPSLAMEAFNALQV